MGSGEILARPSTVDRFPLLIAPTHPLRVPQHGGSETRGSRLKTVIQLARKQETGVFTIIRAAAQPLLCGLKCTDLSVSPVWGDIEAMDENRTVFIRYVNRLILKEGRASEGGCRAEREGRTPIEGRGEEDEGVGGLHTVSVPKIHHPVYPFDQQNPKKIPACAGDLFGWGSGITLPTATPNSWRTQAHNP